MNLISFSAKLSGQNPTDAPFRIPARDLDENFTKLKPLKTDGNNRQYAVNETPNGWSLTLFPDKGGNTFEPVNDVPSDGLYFRDKGEWEKIPDPPPSGIHVLAVQDGQFAWIATQGC